MKPVKKKNIYFCDVDDAYGLYIKHYIFDIPTY